MFNSPIIPSETRKWNKDFQYLQLRPPGSAKSLFPVKEHSRRALRRQRGRKQGELVTPLVSHRGYLVLTMYQVKMSRAVERYLKLNPDKFSTEPMLTGNCAWYFYPNGAPPIRKVDHV